MPPREFSRMANNHPARYFVSAMKQTHSTLIMKQTHSIIRTACVTAMVSLAALTATAQLDPAPAPSPNSPVQPATPAQPLPGEGYKASDALPQPDRKSERFISKLSMLQSEEARLSAIAAQRATNEQVRTFADQVRTSSNAREQELAQLAQARSILVPTGKDSGDLAEENEKWQKKDAGDFDQDYVKRIIRIQKNSVDALEDYAKDNDSDPELVAFAQKHVQGLQEIVRQAETLEKQVD